MKVKIFLFRPKHKSVYTHTKKTFFDDPEDEKLLREIYIDGTQGAYKSI